MWKYELKQYYVLKPRYDVILIINNYLFQLLRLNCNSFTLEKVGDTFFNNMLFRASFQSGFEWLED